MSDLWGEILINKIKIKCKLNFVNWYNNPIRVMNLLGINLININK